jgi:hypothetical protein
MGNAAAALTNIGGGGATGAGGKENAFAKIA